MTREQLKAIAEKMRAEDRAAFGYKDRPFRGEEMRIPGRDGDIRVILYRPFVGEGPFPVYFDMHGGGWVMSDAELDDAFCHLMRKQLSAVIITIDYRKAPEHPFPAALHDVYDTVRYFHENAAQYELNPNCMVIGGHSAGGNLAAATCLLAKETGAFSFRCQVLDFACTDLAEGMDTTPETWYSDAHAWHPGRVFVVSYCTPEQLRIPLVSPLYAEPEQLRGLPPAVILTGDRDPLKDQAEKYAYRLLQASVPVAARRFVDAEHGFTMFFGTQVSRDACAYIVQNVKPYLD